jgi:dTDP-4-dehydrorhamnose 3,5-epimerase
MEGLESISMRVVATKLPGVLVVEPQVFGDDRGFLLETFNKERLQSETGIVRDWIQDNHSQSIKGVLRGLHFQWPHPQGKLVRCSSGVIFDVAVDIRPHSKTFLEWVGLELSSSNHRQLWIPEGFAHGFLALSDRADVEYKVTAYYIHENARAVRWDDPDIGIDWPLEGRPILAAKDELAPPASDVEAFQ